MEGLIEERVREKVLAEVLSEVLSERIGLKEWILHLLKWGNGLAETPRRGRLGRDRLNVRPELGEGEGFGDCVRPCPESNLNRHRLHLLDNCRGNEHLGDCRTVGVDVAFAIQQRFRAVTLDEAGLTVDQRRRRNCVLNEAVVGWSDDRSCDGGRCDRRKARPEAVVDW